MPKQFYMCWDADNSDEFSARPYEAYAAEDAAMEHAEHLNRQDFEFVEGVVAVKHQDGKLEHYDIGHYEVMRFTAELSFDQPGEEEAA